MDPLTIALLAGSIGTNLLGGFVGNSAQKSSNKTNLQIARETNAANTQNYQDYISALYNINSEGNVNQRWLQQNQQAFNSLETQKQREWDSAASQVRRLMEAGVNPASVQSAGGGETAASSGLGSAVANAPSAPHPNVMAQVQPVNAMATALQNISSLAANVGINQANISSSQKMNNEALENAMDIAELNDNTKKQIARDTLSVQEEMNASNRSLNDALIARGNAEVEKLNEETEYQRMVNQGFDKRFQSELDLNAADANHLTKSVAAQFAAISAQLAQAKLQYDAYVYAVDHEDWREAERLKLDWQKEANNVYRSLRNFNAQMAWTSKEFELDEKKFDYQIQTYLREWQARNTGFQPMLRALGFEQIAPAAIGAGQLAIGKGLFNLKQMKANSMFNSSNGWRIEDF